MDSRAAVCSANVRMMEFRDPLWLLGVPVLPVTILVAARRVQRSSLRFPSLHEIRPLVRQSRPVLLWSAPILRAVAVALIAVALARPRQGLDQGRVTTEGIDIVLAVDVSTSMLAEDFELRGQRQNRLEVVKSVVKEFVTHRPNDRIGLVVFAGRPYSACPLTRDHGWLLTQLDRIEIGMVEDGTAIGSGVATALNRLRRSSAKSRLIVLLTDGVNNAGELSPRAAAELARALGVKIYTIGAGTKGMAPYPTTDLFGRRVYQAVKIDVDDEGLTEVARMTGGQYFRATDATSLRTIYQQIDRMEKTTLQQPKFLHYHEQYGWFILPAIGCLLVECVIGQTWLRVLP